jgi:hypothetical protein
MEPLEAFLCKNCYHWAQYRGCAWPPQVPVVLEVFNEKLFIIVPSPYNLIMALV